MRIERHGWDSPHTGRRMPLLRYGVRGAPLIYVPSSAGDEREFARYGMPETCRPWIAAETLQVFAIDGCGPRTLFDDGLDPPERIRRYAEFERYAKDELLDRVYALAARDDLVVVGCSYGGFVAANLLLKRPERVRLACGLGGVYGLWHRLHGYHDDDVYFHTPLEFLPRLADEDTLARIRATEGMALYAAEHDEWLDSSRRLARVFREKDLPHRLEVWAAPADHHERWWRRQLDDFLGRRFGRA